MELNLVPTRWDDEVMDVLRREFYGKYTEEEFVGAMQRDLEHDSQSLISSDELQKATDVYFSRVGGSVVALLVLKYYRWSLLGPQLFFEVLSDPPSFALKPLNKLISAKATYASELAYFWVNPEHRGHGIGRRLFEYTTHQFRQVMRDDDVSFTLSLGNKSHLYAGRDLKSCLLEYERQTNGVDEETGRIRVLSTPLSLDKVEGQLGFPASEISSSVGSIATEVLAKRFGMSFLGYSQNLSLFFATTVGNLS